MQILTGPSSDPSWAQLGYIYLIGWCFFRPFTGIRDLQGKTTVTSLTKFLPFSMWLTLQPSILKSIALSTPCRTFSLWNIRLFIVSNPSHPCFLFTWEDRHGFGHPFKDVCLKPWHGYSDIITLIYYVIIGYIFTVGDACELPPAFFPSCALQEAHQYYFLRAELDQCMDQLQMNEWVLKTHPLESLFLSCIP